MTLGGGEMEGGGRWGASTLRVVAPLRNAQLPYSARYPHHSLTPDLELYPRPTARK